ncbi:hypothetical protein [Aurantiacibacter rhizosphaerae]|uniref:Lipoprotein n=1 Tax=Aurantiacibacter rhizosphaerae TaxID=2691582 RepID=A0A844XFD3_9SPHN|nr:hypothetical protein [Aurantiacibacter rhizosphaerae]MWV28449.1 hypothetical protein [Aurantiacibacter rhizosphaerae]
MKTELKFSAAALLGTFALAACVPPSPEPTPVPTPMATTAQQPTNPQPSSAPQQVVTPTFDNWMDRPQTPGDWRYTADPGETLAVFGTDATPQGVKMLLACNRATGRVGIARQGTANGQVEMLIRTETQDRRLTANPVSSRAPMVVAELASSDPLLDAIAFSKGRFMVQVAGMEPVYAPAWPEITRVIEDCRG